jgi:hypothetical protein
MEAETNPQPVPLRMYGEPSTAPPLAWSWVQDQLERAGTYWVVSRATGHPHPRPVWGVWRGGAVHLSVGSPALARQLTATREATVHLDSGTDVVIVEGRVEVAAPDPEVLTAYDRKYDWRYDVEQYGPLTRIRPVSVLSWRSAGWAGRDGFQEVGRWRFPGT